MSAGRPVLSKYQATSDNGGGIYAITVQPETIAFAIGTTTNAAPAGAVNQAVSARASSSRRIGMNAAGARLSWVGGDAPTGYFTTGTVTIPLLSTAIRAAAVRGATGTYLGKPVVVVGRIPERAR